MVVDKLLASLCARLLQPDAPAAARDTPRTLSRVAAAVILALLPGGDLNAGPAKHRAPYVLLLRALAATAHETGNMPEVAAATAAPARDLFGADQPLSRENLTAFAELVQAKAIQLLGNDASEEVETAVGRICGAAMHVIDGYGRQAVAADPSLLPGFAAAQDGVRSAWPWPPPSADVSAGVRARVIDPVSWTEADVLQPSAAFWRRCPPLLGLLTRLCWVRRAVRVPLLRHA